MNYTWTKFVDAIMQAVHEYSPQMWLECQVHLPADPSHLQLRKLVWYMLPDRELV